MPRNSEIAWRAKLIVLRRRYFPRWCVISPSRVSITSSYLSTRRRNVHPHYELSARHRVPRAPPPLKSLILAGINEFPEESRGITLPSPRLASGDDGGGCMQFCKLELNLLRREKGTDSILSRKMPHDGARETGLLTRRMKLLKRQRHVYLMMKAVTSVARGRKLIHTRHLTYLLICPRKPLLEFFPTNAAVHSRTDPPFI